MRAITLWQPWASLIALGVKRIETRSWSTSHRGPLAIHAATRRPDLDRLEDGLAGEIWDPGDESTCLVQWGQTPARDYRPGTPPPANERWWIWLDSDPIPIHPMPLGAVVATCELADCVPMMAVGDHFDSHLRVGDGLHLVEPDDEVEGWPEEETDVSDQRPYGDFRPGRWAWLLEDIQPVRPPVPARGRQQLWEWAP